MRAFLPPACKTAWRYVPLRDQAGRSSLMSNAHKTNLPLIVRPSPAARPLLA